MHIYIDIYINTYINCIYIYMHSCMYIFNICIGFITARVQDWVYFCLILQCFTASSLSVASPHPPRTCARVLLCVVVYSLSSLPHSISLSPSICAISPLNCPPPPLSLLFSLSLALSHSLSLFSCAFFPSSPHSPHLPFSLAPTHSLSLSLSLVLSLSRFLFLSLSLSFSLSFSLSLSLSLSLSYSFLCPLSFFLVCVYVLCCINYFSSSSPCTHTGTRTTNLRHIALGTQQVAGV